MLKEIIAGKSKSDITMMKYNKRKSDMRIFIHSNIMKKFNLRGKFINLYINVEQEFKNEFYFSVAENLNCILHANKIHSDFKRQSQNYGIVYSREICKFFLNENVDRCEFIFSKLTTLGNKPIYVFKKIMEVKNGN